MNLLPISGLCLLLGLPLAPAQAWQAPATGTGGSGAPGASSGQQGPGVQGGAVSAAAALRTSAVPSKQLFSVGLLPGADPAVIGQAGAEQLASFGQAGFPLSLGGPDKIIEIAWPSTTAAATGLAYLRKAPGVLFTESLRKAAPPESLGCGAVAGPQQCTAAFFDSGPSLPKYAQQPALPVMAVGSDTQAASNALTVVAVIDTGIDPTHPLLLGRLFGPGYDYVLDRAGGWDLTDGLDNDGDTSVDEAFGHGTHVAGLIALMDPAAKLLSYRVLDADGVGNSYAVAAAIYRAVEEGAMIINLSLSLSGPSFTVEEAIEHAVDEGVAVFASAGNTGSEGVLYPARYEEAVAVAALDAFDFKAGFSAYGEDVDLVAPGVEIYSAMPLGQYAWWSGTSMATALASGANSRLISHKPEALLSIGGDDDALALAAGVGEVLVEMAEPVDSLNPNYSGKLGKGRVHVTNAAQALPSAGGGDDGDDD